MSSTIDEQFVEFVVKTIVGNPDKVSIKRTIDEKGVLLELTVDPEDLGRVIGKRGAAAQALRTLLRALGTKNDARYNLKIVDVGGERPPRPDSRPAKTDESRSEDAGEKPAEKPQEDVVAEKEEPAQKTEEPVEEPKEVEEKAEEEQTDAKSSFEKTRRELQDLDDLDI